MLARVLVLACWGVVALGAALLILGGAVVAAAAAVALGSVRAGSAVGTRLTARPRIVSRRPAELPSILPRRLG